MPLDLWRRPVLPHARLKADQCGALTPCKIQFAHTEYGAILPKYVSERPSHAHQPVSWGEAIDRLDGLRAHPDATVALVQQQQFQPVGILLINLAAIVLPYLQ